MLVPADKLEAVHHYLELAVAAVDESLGIKARGLSEMPLHEAEIKGRPPECRAGKLLRAILEWAGHKSLARKDGNPSAVAVIVERKPDTGPQPPRNSNQQRAASGL